MLSTILLSQWLVYYFDYAEPGWALAKLRNVPTSPLIALCTEQTFLKHLESFCVCTRHCCLGLAKKNNNNNQSSSCTGSVDQDILEYRVGELQKNTPTPQVVPRQRIAVCDDCCCRHSLSMVAVVAIRELECRQRRP